MKKLLLLCRKDFLVYRTMTMLSLFFYIIFLALYGLLIITARSNKVLHMEVLFVLAFIVIIDSMLREDDKAENDRMLITMPLRRKEIVLSRYLSGLFTWLVIACVSLVTIALLQLFILPNMAGVTSILHWSSIVIAFFLCALYISSTVLVYARFGYLGYPKSYIVNGIGVMVLLSVVAAGLYVLMSLKSGNWGFSQYIINKPGIMAKIVSALPIIYFRSVAVLGEATIIALSLAILAGAIFLSIKIFNKQEF